MDKLGSAQSPLPVAPIPSDATQLSNQGAEDGSANNPPSEATAPTQSEQAVIDRCRDAALGLEREAQQRIADTCGEIRKLSQLPGRPEFQQIAATINSDVDARFQSSRAMLSKLQSEFLIAHAQWKFFRFQNRLTRSASPPVNHQLLVALLALLIVCESMINSTMFGQGSRQGLIGGFFTAFFISLVSVLSGFLVGRFAIPRLNHVQRSVRHQGILAIVLWVLMTLLLQMLTAHYRDMLERGDLSAHMSAVSHLFQHPLSISVMGIILFAAGVLFSSFAFIDGGNWDDKYLGYGEASRHLERTQSAFDAAKEQLINDVLALGKSSGAAAARLRTGAEANIARMNTLAGSIEPLKLDHATKLSQINGRCHQLLLAYRESNSQVRTTLPPGYFKVFPEFRSVPRYSEIESLAPLVTASQSQLKDITAFETEVNHSEPERTKALRERCDEFLESIARDARANPVVQTTLSSLKLNLKQSDAEPA